MIFHTFPGAVNLFLFAGQISSLPSGSIGSIHSDLSSEIPCAGIDVYHMFGPCPILSFSQISDPRRIHFHAGCVQRYYGSLFKSHPSHSPIHGSLFVLPPRLASGLGLEMTTSRFHRLHLLPLTNPGSSSRVNPQQPPQPNARLLFLA